MLKTLLSAVVLAVAVAGFAGSGAAAVAPERAASTPVSAMQIAPDGVAKLLPQAEVTAAEEVKVARRGRRRAFGAGVAVGVIGALIASGVAESRAREVYDEDWRWEKCAERFRSFEWDTGMYTTYGGDRRLCPYLR